MSSTTEPGRQGLANRKNRLPVGDVIVMLLTEPLLLIV